jgi:hypothetical protein
MKMSRIYNLAAVIVCVLGFVAFGLPQTDNKCPDNDSDRQESVPKNTSAGQAKKENAEVPAKFEAVRFAPKANAFSAGPTKPLSLFGARTDVELASRSQQQAEGDNAQELAKKLSNPIASLTSVPFQNNFDFGMGPNEDGFRYTMNFQPVIPVPLGKDWNVISRTIVPVIAQNNVVETSSQFGLGDTVQSFFFSPNKSEPFVWGAGPVMLIPTATDEALGAQKLGLGPTAVVLKQQEKWTVGMLFNHIWSVAGKESRADFSTTFLQPFVAYTTKTAWTFTINTESTYDWTGESWAVPIHVQVTKLVRVGMQPISVGGALRCWATSAPGGPQWCGFRLVFTPLFPKK